MIETLIEKLGVFYYKEQNSTTYVVIIWLEYDLVVHRNKSRGSEGLLRDTTEIKL